MAPHEIAIAILRKKWTLQIVLLLRHGARRFSDLHHASPLISHKLLTQQLRALERDRLALRRATAERPRQVSYELSETGLSLLPLVDALGDWGRHHASVAKRIKYPDRAHR